MDVIVERWHEQPADEPGEPGGTWVPHRHDTATVVNQTWKSDGSFALLPLLGDEGTEPVGVFIMDAPTDYPSEAVGDVLRVFTGFVRYEGAADDRAHEGYRNERWTLRISA